MPAWLVTASVVWLPFGWWGQVNYWQFVGSLFLLFILLFSRPVQRFVLMRLLGARNPTSREQAILAESWLPIVQRNDLQRRQFVLAVVDTESLNAFACGGHRLGIDLTVYGSDASMPPTQNGQPVAGRFGRCCRAATTCTTVSSHGSTRTLPVLLAAGWSGIKPKLTRCQARCCINKT